MVVADHGTSGPQALAEALGKRAAFVPADATSPLAREPFIAGAEFAFGPDALVNNSGILARMRRQCVGHALEVHQIAPLRMQAVIPAMCTLGRG